MSPDPNEVKAEFQCLDVVGFIEDVDEPTDWISPKVPKKDNDIRFCVDMFNQIKPKIYTPPFNPNSHPVGWGCRI